MRPALRWDTQDIDLAPGGIDDWKIVMSERMRGAQFTEVVLGEGEVAGAKRTGWTSIAAIYRDGTQPEHWTIMIRCGAETDADAASTVDDLRYLMSSEYEIAHQWPPRGRRRNPSYWRHDVTR
jgi:hypothetical protein